MQNTIIPVNADTIQRVAVICIGELLMAITTGAQPIKQRNLSRKQSLRKIDTLELDAQQVGVVWCAIMVRAMDHGDPSIVKELAVTIRISAAVDVVLLQQLLNGRTTRPQYHINIIVVIRVIQIHNTDVNVKNAPIMHIVITISQALVLKRVRHVVQKNRPMYNGKYLTNY